MPHELFHAACGNLDSLTYCRFMLLRLWPRQYFQGIYIAPGNQLWWVAAGFICGSSAVEGRKCPDTGRTVSHGDVVRSPRQPTSSRCSRGLPLAPVATPVGAARQLKFRPAHGHRGNTMALRYPLQLLPCQYCRLPRRSMASPRTTQRAGATRIDGRRPAIACATIRPERSTI